MLRPKPKKPAVTITLDLTCFELDQIDQLAVKYGSDRQGVLCAMAGMSLYIEACPDVAKYLEGWFGVSSGQLLLATQGAA